MTSSNLIDWDAARHRAGTMAPPGPVVDRDEALALVASLRQAAQQAPALVASVTGLQEAADSLVPGSSYVVDRSRWAQANTVMFAHLLGSHLPAPTSALGARLAGEQIGGLLALLSVRVLGQFDPFAVQPDRPGRLLLVAPNILANQRRLNLPPDQFHLWVCLHEQTHAVQFAAAPWLPGHLREAMAAVSQAIADRDSERRLQQLLRAVPSTLSGRDSDAVGSPILGAVLGEEEQQLLGRVLAVMSLLEGHADVVMDEVGPSAIPHVRHIRAAFESRRNSRGLLDVLMGRLLGLDAKLAQYRDGAAFVRGVIGRVGHPGLNAAWTNAQFLPQPSEIADPAAWVSRVHG
ncbi:MAG: zinc-dependent metalloprotease [Beutenbergiaceae bacterium]